MAYDPNRLVADSKLSPDEWLKTPDGQKFLRRQRLITDAVGRMEFLPEYLRNYRRIDEWPMDIESAPAPDEYEPPKTVKARWTTALRNYLFIMREVYLTTEAVRAVDQFHEEYHEEPGTTEAHVALSVLYGILSASYQLAEYESFHDTKLAIRMLKGYLRRARRVCETQLYFAAARIEVTGGATRAAWSPYYPVKKWLAMFREAGQELTDDTLANRISAGLYRKNPHSKKGHLSLDLATLPTEVAAIARGTPNQHRT